MSLKACFYDTMETLANGATKFSCSKHPANYVMYARGVFPGGPTYHLTDEAQK